MLDRIRDYETGTWGVDQIAQPTWGPEIGQEVGGLGLGAELKW
jgi:hypothetical protein